MTSWPPKQPQVISMGHFKLHRCHDPFLMLSSHPIDRCIASPHRPHRGPQGSCDQPTTSYLPTSPNLVSPDHTRLCSMDLPPSHGASPRDHQSEHTSTGLVDMATPRDHMCIT